MIAEEKVEKALRAGVILMTSDRSQVLLVFGNYSHKWSPPKGGIEVGETIEACALRECREETGLAIVLPSDAQPICIRKQHYYCVVAPNDDVLTIPLIPTDVREIKEAKWISWDDTENLKPENCNAITLELFRSHTKERVFASSVVAQSIVKQSDAGKIITTTTSWIRKPEMLHIAEEEFDNW